jgi:adenosylcobinamide-phosphate synthase
VLHLSVEHSVLSAHRHVYGVLAWYCVLAVLGAGPTGAVLYRLAEFVPRYWTERERRTPGIPSPALLTSARFAWHLIDWIPARITALAVAMAGSFEEAMDSWRSQSPDRVRAGHTENDAIMLSAAMGAMGLTSGTAPDQPLQLGHLRTVVGLVWRVVVIWLLVLGLMTLARWAG